jgi:hypothetical protein
MLVAAILAIMCAAICRLPSAWSADQPDHHASRVLLHLPGRRLLMDVPARQLPDALTWEWISGELSTLWQPFLLGSV